MHPSPFLVVAKDLDAKPLGGYSRVRRAVAAEEAAALEKRLTYVATSGGACRSCRNAEARAALARLRKIAGA